MYFFPNRAAAERLIDAVLMDHHEAWITGARYLDAYSDGFHHPFRFHFHHAFRLDFHHLFR